GQLEVHELRRVGDDRVDIDQYVVPARLGKGDRLAHRAVRLDLRVAVHDHRQVVAYEDQVHARVRTGARAERRERLARWQDDVEGDLDGLVGPHGHGGLEPGEVER